MPRPYSSCCVIPVAEVTLFKVFQLSRTHIIMILNDVRKHAVLAATPVACFQCRLRKLEVASLGGCSARIVYLQCMRAVTLVRASGNLEVSRVQLSSAFCSFEGQLTRTLEADMS